MSEYPFMTNKFQSHATMRIRIKQMTRLFFLLVFVVSMLGGAGALTGSNQSVLAANGITLDGSVSSATADGVSSIQFAHTTGTGVNRLTLVGVSANSYNNARTISSVVFSYGMTNLSLTEVGSRENEAGRLTAIYSLVGPPSGQAGTVTVTFSDTVGYGIVAGAVNFAGVDQADPLDDYVSAVGTNATPISVDVPTDLDDLVFDTLFLGGATPPSLAAGASQTNLWDATVDRVRGVASDKLATTSSTTMSWTASGGSTEYYWAIGAVPINPAPAGATYDLTIAVDPVAGGTTTPSAGVHTYPEGYVEVITATPVFGYAFDYWSGACSGNGTCQVTMDADKSVTAHFTASLITQDGDISSATADGVSSIQFAHTTGTGENRLTLVGVSANSYNNARTISSVVFSYGMTNLSLTEVGSIENEAGRLTAIYSLVGPPSGQAGTVTVTFSDTVGYGIVAGAVNFAGVDQGDPLDDYASAVGTNTTPISVDVPTDLDDLVFDTVFMGGAEPPSLAAGANQTKMWDATVDRIRGVASGKQATSSSTTMSWTASGGSAEYYWAIGAVPINPAPPPCYALTLSHTGLGSNPVASPANSTGCLTGEYLAGETINLSGAVPASGWQISSWTGTDNDTSTASTNTVTMPDSPHNASVNYSEIGYYSLTIAVEPVGAGSTNPAVGVHSYAEGTVVNVTATAVAGYTFDYWSGACTGDGTCQITMDADKSVTAHFEEVTYDLTIVVDPVGGGTTVPAAGVHSYADGFVVDITATAAAGYAFDHWSGACTGDGACQVTMDADKSVTAHFEEVALACYALTLSHSGQGSDPVASPTNSSGCPVGEYVAGEVINLSGAVPDSGWGIIGWTGTDNDTSTASTNIVTMPASDHAVSVQYSMAYYYLYLPLVLGG